MINGPRRIRRIDETNRLFIGQTGIHCRTTGVNEANIGEHDSSLNHSILEVWSLPFG